MTTVVFLKNFNIKRFNESGFQIFRAVLIGWNLWNLCLENRVLTIDVSRYEFQVLNFVWDGFNTICE